MVTRLERQHAGGVGDGRDAREDDLRYEVERHEARLGAKCRGMYEDHLKRPTAIVYTEPVRLRQRLCDPRGEGWMALSRCAWGKGLPWRRRRYRTSVGVTKGKRQWMAVPTAMPKICSFLWQRYASAKPVQSGAPTQRRRGAVQAIRPIWGAGDVRIKTAVK